MIFILSRFVEESGVAMYTEAILIPSVENKEAGLEQKMDE